MSNEIWSPSSFHKEKKGDPLQIDWYDEQGVLHSDTHQRNGTVSDLMFAVTTVINRVLTPLTVKYPHIRIQSQSWQAVVHSIDKHGDFTYCGVEVGTKTRAMRVSCGRIETIIRTASDWQVYVTAVEKLILAGNEYKIRLRDELIAQMQKYLPEHLRAADLESQRRLLALDALLEPGAPGAEAVAEHFTAEQGVRFSSAK